MTRPSSSSIADALESISEDAWDVVVKDLERQGGMAVVSLPPALANVHSSGFAAARRCLHHKSLPQIPPNADSAHATGYHGPEGMSRYNMYREGVVFSDGNLMDVMEDSSFRPCMEELFGSMHGIAEHVLRALERQWNLPINWFQENVGPTAQHSQWHAKRYVEPNAQDDAQNEPVILLPVHTDPSLISIVIHDRPGLQPEALGLQYQAPYSSEKNGPREWIPVPQSGHAVATVFVGSVLSYMTGGTVASAKHRVVATSHNDKVDKERMAATLFVRPRGTAVLKVPPSRCFASVALKKRVDFHTWSARVARNYGKGKAILQNVTQQECKKSPKEPRPENDNSGLERIGYFRDQYTELSLIPCDPPLTGREKYLGGELGANGKIYTIPGHALRVLVIDPTVEPPTIRPIGPAFHGEFKWLRGVRTSTGIIYGIPCHADSVLRIDTSTDTVSTLTWDASDSMAPPVGLPWKWHGGNLAPSDGCLYCIPQFAEHILKLDPMTERLSFLGGPFPGRNKWYGGLLGPKDGAIYGINQNASGVLRIDPATQTAGIFGSFPQGCHLWHGGVVGPDGCIYGIPAHADTVLKVEPGETPRISTIGANLRTGAHRSDGKYKYLGGAVGQDGNVYLFPSDADYVLQINPKTEQVREVGPNLRDVEKIHHNKWQNGFTAPDGTIYGIPLKSRSIIRIRPGDGSCPDISTIGCYDGLNKWEGGVMSKGGDCFCMPLNHAMILRMKPVADVEKRET